MEISQVHFLQNDIKMPTIKCSKCGSIYVDDNVCESCGFKLDFDRLGEPLGKYSVFVHREDLEEQYKYFGVQFTPLKFSPHTKKYLRYLYRRFEYLVDYLLSDKDSGELKRKLFFEELKIVITELSHYGEDLKKIASHIENHDNHTEYRIVSSVILNFIMDLSLSIDHRSFLLKFYEWKVLGISAFNIIIACAFLGAIIASSQSIIGYYLQH